MRRAHGILAGLILGLLASSAVAGPFDDAPVQVLSMPGASSSSGGISAVNGTANQIDATTTAGVTTLSLDPVLVTPGSIAPGGTGGLGFLELQPQTPVPTAPAANRLRIYTNSVGALGVKNSANISALFQFSALTVGRTYTYPDATGTFALTSSPTLSNLTVTGSFTATGLVTNAALANPSTTVNGQTCTLGAACTVTAVASGVTVGTTTVGGGADTRVLFDNAGVLSEYVISGTGSVCMTTNCAMTTPNLGTPSAAVLTNATSIPAGQLTGSIVNARLPSAMATTSLALGGAIIGTDALGVTGTATISGAVATGTLNATGNVIASSSLQAGSTASIFIGSRGSTSAAADGVWTLKNNAGTAFGRLQFGGTTSSFPSIKQNGAAFNFRLADDTADTAITAAAATLSGTLTASAGHVEAPRIVTAAGAVTMATTDYVVMVNKTVGAATTVNLPSSPTTGQHYYIKDGKGDAATNNITVTPAAGNIDGAGTLVMNVNYMAIELIYNGTQWNVI